MPPEVSELTSDCGHHCGVNRVGKAKHVGHCVCEECHGKALTYAVVVKGLGSTPFVLWTATDQHEWNAAVAIGEAWAKLYVDDIVMVVDYSLYGREMLEPTICNPREI